MPLAEADQKIARPGDAIQEPVAPLVCFTLIHESTLDPTSNTVVRSSAGAPAPRHESARRRCTDMVMALCPPASTEWRCNLDVFRIALARRWPGAFINQGDEPTRAVIWELRRYTSFWLDGSINQDGQACYLKGSPALVADFVTWFRESEPIPQLVLVLDADGTPHPIPAGVTHSDVLALL